MPSFRDFYSSLHGREPFPWQQRLAERVAAGRWPDALNLPTSAGKTAVIDVWLWAHVEQIPHTPRRLHYVIDRRALVDAVTLYAEDAIRRAAIAASVVRLRGGVGAADDAWLLDPAQPALISTTVDQIGSRLLCRAYGVGRYSAPIHAGLAGNDALIVLDEAHLIAPLQQTLAAVARLRQSGTDVLPLPWHVLTMTATPQAQSADVLTLEDADRAHPLLRQRLAAAKLTKVTSGGSDSLVAEAMAHRKAGAAVVGVVVNTVAMARSVFEALRRQGEALLLIGRARPLERDALGAELLAIAGTGTRAAGRGACFVVATQTIEVGLDLDLDALVTELAPVSALRQRFGRLDRLGELGTTRASVVRSAGAEWPYDKAELAAALAWLEAGAVKQPGAGKVTDMGVAAQPPAPAEAPLLAPVVTAVDVELMFDPAVDIDISPYLHGERRALDAYVAWRAALDLQPADEWADVVEDTPPTGPELMPVPVYALRQWLLGKSEPTADIEGARDAPESEDKAAPPAPRTAVRWDGEFAELVEPQRIRAGDVVVVPASYGGCDRFGWHPSSRAPVRDLYEAGLVQRPRWAGNNMRTRHAVPLAAHLAGVAQAAADIARSCELPTPLAEAVTEAARLHDLGKNDPRFQLMLGAEPGSLLAKSGTHEVGVSRELAGLPRGWRHEIASVAQRPALDPLVRYLIGTHHGRGRPWLPAAPDVRLWREAGGANWPALARQMQQRFGPWGLAYLEALVRLADWRRSVDEQAQAEAVTTASPVEVAADA
jgi:CRISPR-associated endonuclease/helicase Cas3